MIDKQQIIKRIEALQPMRQLVDSMDMRARKSLGQNFLFDLNLTRRIVRSAGTLSRSAGAASPWLAGLPLPPLLAGA